MQHHKECTSNLCHDDCEIAMKEEAQLPEFNKNNTFKLPAGQKKLLELALDYIEKDRKKEAKECIQSILRYHNGYNH